MKQKAVITTIAPDSPAAIPDGIVPAGAVALPLASVEAVPYVEVPADTPARDLPDALAPRSTPTGSVQPLEQRSTVVVVETSPAITLEGQIREKIAVGLTRAQAEEVIDNQARHDAGLV